MKGLRIAVMFLVLIGLACGFAADVFAQNDRHVWLHVQGKYIRKSPYCTDPNGGWMGCGIAHRNQEAGDVVHEALAQWMKDNNCNLSRFSIQSFQGMVWINDRTAEECYNEFTNQVKSFAYKRGKFKYRDFTN